MLEDAGFVRRVADPADRRSNLVSLTEEGRATLERIRTERTAFLRCRLDDLDAAERDQLATALPILIRLVEAGPR
jgi:DNA-binding MarR family transcriptional regulator